MADILTGVIFVSMAVGGLCGLAALVLVYLKRDVRPVVSVFALCVVLCFVAMLLLPR